MHPISPAFPLARIRIRTEQTRPSSSSIKLGASGGPSSLPIALEEGGEGDRGACSNPDPDFFPSSAASIAAACPG